VILGNTYVFYGDVYFVSNFLIKASTLFLITISFGKRIEVSVRKVLSLACAATIAEIIGLCVLPSYVFFVVFVNLFEVPFLVYLLLAKKGEIIGKGIIRGYVFTVIINGVLEILWNYFGETGSYFMIIVLSCISVVLSAMMYASNCKRKKGVFNIVLKHMEEEIETCGFYDSGNCLKDPYTNKGVHIISESIMEKMIPKGMNKVLIPYQTLGVSEDLIEVVYIDEVVIYGEKDIVRQHKIPLGIAKEEMFLNKSYKMILNEEVF